jgi:hypothetical protein
MRWPWSPTTLAVSQAVAPRGSTPTAFWSIWTPPPSSGWPRSATWMRPRKPPVAWRSSVTTTSPLASSRFEIVPVSVAWNGAAGSSGWRVAT